MAVCASLKVFGAIGVSLSLASCGGEPTPSAVQGTWGADCSTPFIKIDGSEIHIYPDDADYKVKTVTFDGKNLVLGYDSKEGPALETYVFTNNTLRLDRGRYTGMDAIWHKQPMQRC